MNPFILVALFKIIIQNLNAIINPTNRMLRQLYVRVAYFQVHLALSNHFMAHKVLYTMCTFTYHMQSVRDLEFFCE